MQQIADPVERSGDRPAGRASAARVSKEELRNRLHRQGPRLNRSYRRFDDAQSAYTDTGKAVTALANACDGYRRDVLALRKSLAAGRGGRPQRLLLTTYDAVAAALAAYKKGILFETKAEGQRALAHSKAEWRRASRYAVEARRALD